MDALGPEMSPSPLGPEMSPSQEALYAARLLGNEMARREPRLAPNLRNVAQFDDISHFRRVHREALEHNDAFRVWHERLLNITEREAERFGLRLDDSMTSWDIWYDQIAQPLKKAMWTAWEAWYELPRRFHAAAARQRQQQPTATPLRVAARVTDTTHLMEVGAQALSLSEPPGFEVEASPAADAPEPVTGPTLQLNDRDVPPTNNGVNGIGAGNQISVDGDSWSI